MFEHGVVPEKLLGREYGHRMHMWDLRERKHRQTIDLGDEHQMVLELRPAHDPRRDVGFVGVVVSVEDLRASIWHWYRGGRHLADPEGHHDPGRAGGTRGAAAAAEGLRRRAAARHRHQSVARRPLALRLLLGHGRVPAVRRQRPVRPKHTGRSRLGGIASRAAHPASGPLNGGPQMVEVSRDGRRVYVSNSLYSTLGHAVLPGGRRGLDREARRLARRGMTVDPEFLTTELRRPASRTRSG